MIIRMITESAEFLDNDFTTKSEIPIDIQWKIYRGTLSRQSLPISIYNKFKEQYDKFYELYELFIEEPDTFNLGIKSELDQLNSSLAKTLVDLEPQLGEEAMFELKIAVEKIMNYISDMNVKISNDFLYNI